MTLFSAPLYCRRHVGGELSGLCASCSGPSVRLGCSGVNLVAALSSRLQAAFVPARLDKCRRGGVAAVAAAIAAAAAAAGRAIEDCREQSARTAQSKGPPARWTLCRHIQASPTHPWRQRHQRAWTARATLAPAQATPHQTLTLTRKRTRTTTRKRTERAGLRSTRQSWVHSPHAPWTPCGGWSGMASGASAGIELPQPLPRRRTRQQGTWAMHTRSGRGNGELPSSSRSLADGVES